ncbi:MAG TPA: VIT domain-containing protein [Phycisphaerae bacterium]|nr:VIT domain-containing protein [Phycisphaerae bacterium]
MRIGKWIAWSTGLLALVLVLAMWGCESVAERYGGLRQYAPVSPMIAGKLAQSVTGANGVEYWIVPTDGVQDRVKRRNQEAMRQNIDVDGHVVDLPIPGSAVLAARQADGKLVPVPLKHTEVDAKIAGYVASVGVTQQFTNPFSEKIEAVYVFPLPENAGVNEFVMTIGERHIRGIIRERSEAEKIYKEARAQGYVASMMTQERPNIFTQNVANIEPGKQIDIAIRYFHTLSYADGWYEWVFPMVVGPRYNPNGADAPVGRPGTGIGAVAAGQPGISGQKTEVQFLRPEDRSGHDIGLTVQLDAGMKIEELQSVNHRIVEPRVKMLKANQRFVELAAEDRVPNKDFVLRWKVAGEKVKTAMFVQKDKEGKGGWFTLMLVPPEELKDLPRRPVEMVFVVDTSGSMGGAPIAQAKAAVDVALSRMNPMDTFQVVKFDSTAGQFSPMPLAASAENTRAARQYVAGMQGGGGTEMLKGMNAALGFPHDENHTRVVAFLTDGFIGNEIEVLKGLHSQLLDSRVFSFGVGSSTNRYLLDAMARLGHGSAAYLSLNESAQPVMEKYFQEISHPAMANVKVGFEGSGMKVSEVYPQRVPELFVGRPIVITGRYAGEPGGSVNVTGVAGDQKVTFAVSTSGAGGAVEENPAIATVWARAKVADLHDEAIYEGRDVTADVKATALSYGIMSEFTSFVAVDSTRKTESDHGTTVGVPVPVPEGVRYETTVQTTRGAGEN